ncbi:MAG: hypothetical protein JW727_02340 [Candidatus Aenigmarchaeota archaeon]|nr:hypothetical protein [Candidatus Aenigmarchaeota archaeon]
MVGEEILRSSCTSVILECRENSRIGLGDLKAGALKSFEQIESIGAGISEKLSKLKVGDRVILTFLTAPE